MWCWRCGSQSILNQFASHSKYRPHKRNLKLRSPLRHLLCLQANDSDAAGLGLRNGYGSTVLIKGAHRRFAILASKWLAIY
jgi:hypothetical protein